MINDCNTFQVLLKSNLINYLTGVSYYQYSFELSKMWTILDKSSWCAIPVSYVGRHRDLQIILYLFSRVGNRINRQWFSFNTVKIKAREKPWHKHIGAYLLQKTVVATFWLGDKIELSMPLPYQNSFFIIKITQYNPV